MGAVLQDASSRAANVQEPSLLWHLQGECAKLAAGGDWDGVNVLHGAGLQRGKATKAKARRKVRACAMLEPMRRMRRRTLRISKKKRNSENQREGTVDDAWWLGSMGALTREPIEYVGMSLRLKKGCDKQV